MERKQWQMMRRDVAVAVAVVVTSWMHSQVDEDVFVVAGAVVVDRFVGQHAREKLCESHRDELIQTHTHTH